MLSDPHDPDTTDNKVGDNYDLLQTEYRSHGKAIIDWNKEYNKAGVVNSVENYFCKAYELAADYDMNRLLFEPDPKMEKRGLSEIAETIQSKTTQRPLIRVIRDGSNKPHLSSIILHFHETKDKKFELMKNEELDKIMPNLKHTVDNVTFYSNQNVREAIYKKN